MRHALALVTPPAAEPVTVAEARAWLRIDGADDDATLGALITAARQAAEEHLRRSLVTQTWKLTLDGAGGRGEWVPGVYELPVDAFDGEPPRTLDLPKGPVQAVTTVTTYGTDNAGTVFPAPGYRLSGDRLALNPGFYWPGSLRPQGGTEILYTAGYGDAAAVPRPIKQGILIHAASLYEQRGMCDDPSGLPAGCLALYAPYRTVAPRG